MKIKAQDGAVCSINGTPYSIPKGTELNIRLGTKSGLVTTGFDQNGDNTVTPLYGVNTGMIEGLVLSITTDDQEDSFNELFESDDHQVVISSGGTDYTIESALLISPSEDGVPSISTINRKTEAFNIKSMSGQIKRS